MDSSALLAVILDEPDGDRLLAAMAAAPVRKISAANWFETAMRVDNHENPVAAQRFEALIAHLGIEVVPVSVGMALAARAANRRFGRGSGSKAKLNFGDCFAYALAHVADEPLLFKGNDFPWTDLMPAAY